MDIKEIIECEFGLIVHDIFVLGQHHIAVLGGGGCHSILRGSCTMR